MKRLSNDKFRFVRRFLVAALGVLITSASAFAERADRAEKVSIEFDRGVKDDLAKTADLDGNVVLTQGTLKINAARMRVKRDQNDNVFAEIFGSTGQQVVFREKREGSAGYMEGWADRAEFDQVGNTVKLFSKARVKSGNDLVSGDYISYNTETEKFEVTSQSVAGKPGTAATDAARSQLVFQPRTDATKTVPKK